jgi:hypothetical protein
MYDQISSNPNAVKSSRMERMRKNMAALLGPGFSLIGFVFILKFRA